MTGGAGLCMMKMPDRPGHDSETATMFASSRMMEGVHNRANVVGLARAVTSHPRVPGVGRSVSGVECIRRSQKDDPRKRG